MDTFYLACAAGGGALLICQFIMTLAGLGDGHHDFSTESDHDPGHHDFGLDHDHGSDGHAHSGSWFVGMLSFRAMVAAITFFGLAGKFGIASGYTAQTTLILAIAAGLSAMFLVAWLMRSLYRLRSEGTIRIERSVGALGTVYLTVPANKAGAGKVTLSVQDRTMEYQAITSEPNELPTGTQVVAVAVVGPSTVEVSPVPSTERVAHV